MAIGFEIQGKKRVSICR